MNDDRSKEIKKGELPVLKFNNNDKTGSNMSSSDNGLSGNSNRDNRPTNQRALTYSPLGRIMNKIGLKFGD